MPFTIMHILPYNRSYPKTVLGPVPCPLCPVPSYDVGKVQKLESLEMYDYLTLFQYPCLYLLHYTQTLENHGPGSLDEGGFSKSIYGNPIGDLLISGPEFQILLK